MINAALPLRADPESANGIPFSAFTAPLTLPGAGVGGNTEPAQHSSETSSSFGGGGGERA